MTRVEKLKAKDIVSLMEKDKASCIGVSEINFETLERNPYSYSVFYDDRLIACAGVVEYWTGRGEAWAIIDNSCRNYFVVLHNAAKRFLEVCPIKRIEAAVDVGFKNGHRWVKALGFKMDAPLLKAFLPNGKDASLYSRVREG